MQNFITKVNKIKTLTVGHIKLNGTCVISFVLNIRDDEMKLPFYICDSKDHIGRTLQRNHYEMYLV